MTRFVGIDPGASGGVAWIDSVDGEILGVGAVTMPDTRIALWQVLKNLTKYGTTRVAIEKVHAIPHSGSTSSAFAFGRNAERPECLVDVLSFDPQLISSWGLVPPQTWQRSLGLGKLEGRDRKKALCQLARRRFAANAKLVTLKTCDALLIADWLRNGGVTQ